MQKIKRNELGIQKLTLFIIIFAFGFMVAEYLLRFNSPDMNDRAFANQCLNYAFYSFAIIIYMTLALAGLVPRLKIVKDDYFGWNKILLQFIMGFILVVIVQFVSNYFLREITALVSDLEIILFYFTGAIQEVILFQLLIQNVIEFAMRKNKSLRNYAVITSILVTNIFFMLAHLGVYQQAYLLAGVFGIGTIFSIFYYISRNLLIPFLLHGLNNVIAVFAVLVSPEDLFFAFLILLGLFLTFMLFIYINHVVIRKMKEDGSNLVEIDKRVTRLNQVMLLIAIIIVTIAILFVLANKIVFINVIGG
ncbi:MAG: CPBP family glutamic-type intramembrane protease [Promethearchaeota archaeon]